MPNIKENLKIVLDEIESSAQKVKRDKQEIKLIAVTKTYGPELINEAISNGVTDIGENRVQEILEKFGNVLPVKWHLIGHLQKNKVKYIIDKVELIHSVDSLALAEEINKQAKKIGKIQRILIQVNVSGEESKFGIKPSECEELCRAISKLENLKIEGLMTIAPFVENKNAIKNIFCELRQISLDISAKNIDTVSMGELSMGMTNDYPEAIECGATMVRVGTGIFGKRDYPNNIA